MCGILGVVGKIEPALFESCLKSISHRGPDNSNSIECDGPGVTFGFNRLIVNGDGVYANQPFVDENTTWAICNGEIFNHKEIENTIEYSPMSGSDCEVLIPAFKFWSFPTFCNKLDAEFALMMYDTITKTLWVARDPYGVRPLFWGQTDTGAYAFASEMKALHTICRSCEQFHPGHFMRVDCQGTVPVMAEYTRYSVGLQAIGYKYLSNVYACNKIRHLLSSAVQKRLMCDAGGVCCLLSGGLDSSLVSGLANRFSRDPIHTFSIGMKGSTDLAYAKEVADSIGSVHHTVCLPESEFLGAIPEVIRAIESYDVTTVRASVGNYLIGKYIKENTSFKVVLNGDYSDEVTGGYLYMKLAPGKDEFHTECKRLVDNIHYFDSLRSDRCICAHGLEARAPFADKEFVEFYLSMDPGVSSPPGKMEKYLLRDAFRCDMLIPDNVLWRTKEAFSDGVSGVENSWHVIARKHAMSLGFVSEEEYYKSVFDDEYGQHNRGVIPYKWMPKYCDSTDPSARTICTHTTPSVAP